MPLPEILYKQKVRAYRMLYEFTKSQCSDCSKTDCACKDTICAHVETQAALAGVKLEKTAHKLRFIGCNGCVVPPHLRETCTIYLCRPAQERAGFPVKTYERLKNICAAIDLKLMDADASMNASS